MLNEDVVLIEIAQLSKHFGDAHVLRGIALQAERGEVVAIIGPSGGGKSTFLRCINGLETFDAGHIRVGTLELHPQKRPPAAQLQAIRQKVGFVFQQFHLFPHMTVLQNLMEAPILVQKRPREVVRQEAMELLERVGLGEKAHVFPRLLSGGEQQRVAICRTLALQPEVILLDEPTSALDPMMAAEVQGVIADLARGGRTMLIVTHSLRFARAIATQVHVFADGQVVERGPPTQVFDAPQHPVTQAFLRNSVS